MKLKIQRTYISLCIDIQNVYSLNFPFHDTLHEIHENWVRIISKGFDYSRGSLNLDIHGNTIFNFK